MGLETYEFKKSPEDYNVYWDVRKGLIPIVGAARETGGNLSSSALHCAPPHSLHFFSYTGFSERLPASKRHIVTRRNL